MLPLRSRQVRSTVLLLIELPISFRDLNITVGRIRLAAGEIDPPKSANASLHKVIWDQCWIERSEKLGTDRDLSENDKEIRRDPTPMIALKVHEDPEMGITTVGLARSLHLHSLLAKGLCKTREFCCHLGHLEHN
jgi:hypothetical protein